MFQNVPLAIKSYIACFLPLDDYVFMNSLRIPRNFPYYYKHNKLPEHLTEVCNNKKTLLLPLIEYLYKQGVPYSFVSLDWAVHHEHCEIAKFLNKELKLNIVYPASYTKLDTISLKQIKILHSINCTFTGSIIFDFIKANRVDVIKYLYNEAKIEMNASHLMHAIFYLNIEVVKFLHEECKIEITEQLHEQTLQSYNQFSKCTVEQLKYFHSIGININENVLKYACRDNTLEVVKFLHEEIGVPFDTGSYSYYNSYVSFDIDILKYMKSKGCKYNQNTIEYAIRRNKLDIVKYLHYEENVKCTKYTLTIACICLHLEIVKFLHEELSIPVTKRMIIQTQNTARYYGNKIIDSVLDYLTLNYYLKGTPFIQPIKNKNKNKNKNKHEDEIKKED